MTDRFDRGFGQHIEVTVQSSKSGGMFLPDHGCFRRFKDALYRLRDFGTDAVAGNKDNRMLCHSLRLYGSGPKRARSRHHGASRSRRSYCSTGVSQAAISSVMEATIFWVIAASSMGDNCCGSFSKS